MNVNTTLEPSCALLDREGRTMTLADRKELLRLAAEVNPIHGNARASMAADALVKWVEVYARRERTGEVIATAERLQRQLRDNPMNDIDRERFAQQLERPSINQKGFRGP